MTVFDSIILGIVEGLTEYLPVSSTGHLIVTEALLGMKQGASESAFAVCIQGGAILAVLGIYMKRVKGMVMGLFGKDPQGFKLLINMLIAFIPAAVIGFLLDDKIKDYLFGITPVIVAWVVGGAGILVYTRARERQQLEKKGMELEDLTPKQSLIIGLLQCVAMWPGTSRSLMTMLGGMFVGLSLSAAVEFSFILGLITLGAATCYDALKHGQEMVSDFGWESLVAGTVAAWFFAAVAVKWMVAYLQKHSFAIFGWYRILAGVCVAIAVACHWLSL